jgi:hypothetical protein
MSFPTDLTSSANPAPPLPIDRITLCQDPLAMDVP